jgi:hypothetical protein
MKSYQINQGLKIVSLFMQMDLLEVMRIMKGHYKWQLNLWNEIIINLLYLLYNYLLIIKYLKIETDYIIF